MLSVFGAVTGDTCKEFGSLGMQFRKGVVDLTCQYKDINWCHLNSVLWSGTGNAQVCISEMPTIAEVPRRISD
jgi:hypothetical protein